MKISYSNFPILKKIKDKSLGRIPVAEIDVPIWGKIWEQFASYWKHYLDYTVQDINYISQPFIDATSKCSLNLRNLYINDIVGSSKDYRLNETFIVNQNVIQVCNIYNALKDEAIIAMFVFSREGMPLGIYIDHNHIEFKWASLTQVSDNKTELDNFLNTHLMMCVFFDLFKKYAQVETKELKANSKTKDFNCKYINDTSLSITYLTSTWFTNLVKSDGFTVRGHFRLQPKKKDGEWTKELIWISEFEKSGYTAPARKLNNQ